MTASLWAPAEYPAPLGEKPHIRPGVADISGTSGRREGAAVQTGSWFPSAARSRAASRKSHTGNRFQGCGFSQAIQFSRIFFLYFFAHFRKQSCSDIDDDYVQNTVIAALRALYDRK